MGIFKKIKLKHKDVLKLKLENRTIIITNINRKQDDERLFMWVTLEKSNMKIPDYDFHLVNENGILRRIEAMNVKIPKKVIKFLK